MASLWALFCKGKFNCEPRLHKTILGLKDKQPRLVNITDFVGDWLSRDYELAAGPLDATPCHPWLWLEYLYEPNHIREAILVNRISAVEALRQKQKGVHLPEIPLGANHSVFIAAFEENEGLCSTRGVATFFVDKFGEPINDSDCPDGFRDFSAVIDEGDEEWINIQVRLALEVLSAMNTRGTRIEPPLERPKAEIVKPNRAPHSVWHTIHLPKFQGPPLTDAEVTPEVLERRRHWVRAHRKDYRRGTGLFGRVKALVWIPEFQRGNPELGTVKQSFTVHPQPEEERL